MEPVEWVPYQHQYRYPHMSPADTAIWERYISANPAAFDAVAYDVAIGSSADFDTIVNPATGGDAARLYQRRVDVLARSGSITWVIELKPRASTGAIGQVSGYRMLIERDLPTTHDVRALIITDSLLPDMEFIAAAQKVEIRVA